MTPRMNARVRALVPALLLAVSVTAAGTLPGGVTFLGATAGQLMVLLLAPLAAGSLADPLALGRHGRRLPAILMLVVMASWVLSPVGRAGRVGVTLLPAWLLLPAAVASCWPDRRSRERGVRAVAAVVAAVAVWSLADWLGAGSPGAAMPLGHHNALAGWLLLTWPLALAGGAGRGPRIDRSSVLVVVAAAAIWASGSLAGILCWSAQMLLWWLATVRTGWRGGSGRAESGAGRSHHGRWIGGLLILGVLAMLVTQGPRLEDLWRGFDRSFQARQVYLSGGFEGWRERPLLGWGPGSVRWTVGEFLEPLPGVNPPGEVVGDLHSLPAQLLYETGALGLSVAIGVALLFVVRRGRELRAERHDPEEQGDSRPLRTAAIPGLMAIGGGALFSLSHAALTPTALPMAAVVSGGLCLAPRRNGGVSVASSAGARVVVWLYVVACGVLLAPTAVAHFSYDRAVQAEDPAVARSWIRRAVSSDPGFPLYVAREAWFDPGRQGGAAAAERSIEAVSGSLAAAEAAPGVAVLWLAAGTRALDAGDSRAAELLERACRLDRLAPTAPFHLALALGTSSPGRAVAAGARALAAEPRLAAALWWEQVPELSRSTTAAVNGWPSTSLAWRRTVSRALGEAPGRSGPTADLVVEIDRTPALSFSTYAFHRRPWPARLAVVKVRSRQFEAIGMEAARGGRRPGSGAFEVGCGERRSPLGGPSEER